MAEAEEGEAVVVEEAEEHWLPEEAVVVLAEERLTMSYLLERF